MIIDVGRNTTNEGSKHQNAGVQIEAAVEPNLTNEGSNHDQCGEVAEHTYEVCCCTLSLLQAFIHQTSQNQLLPRNGRILERSHHTARTSQKVSEEQSLGA